ncbi:TPA: hypothetical protein ACNIWQ_005565, partial [Escherichia coli]
GILAQKLCDIYSSIGCSLSPFSFTHWNPLLISCLTLTVGRLQGVLTNQKGVLTTASKLEVLLNH